MKILLITSDEPTLRGREPAEKNAEYIREHYRKIGAEVTLQHLELEYFEDNSVNLASQIIAQYRKHPDVPIVLDISAGRGTIRQALSRGGDIAVDYIHRFYDPTVTLTAVIKSANKPVISYEIGKPLIPDEKDLELLRVVEKDMTQTSLTRELGWNHQSEVSKSLKRLMELELVENHGHKTRELTGRGKLLQKLLKYLESATEEA